MSAHNTSLSREKEAMMSGFQITRHDPDPMPEREGGGGALGLPAGSPEPHIERKASSVCLWCTGENFLALKKFSRLCQFVNGWVIWSHQVLCGLPWSQTRIWILFLRL